MVTEIATVTISEGNELAFEASMRATGLAALEACPGVISVQFGRGAENPSTFAFVVEWASVEAHEAARDTETFKAFRASFGTHGIGGTMQHFDLR
jgi:quinol monooxygenase YgiN